MADDVVVVQPSELARKDLRRAVRICVRAWPFARVDMEAVGFRGSTEAVPTGLGGHGDPTASTAIRLIQVPDPAEVWLAELFDVVTLFLPPGERWWAPPRPEDQVGDTSGRWPSPDPTVVGVMWLAGVELYADRFPHGRKARDEWMVLARRVYTLADMAARCWATPPKGAQVGGVTVGERGNSTVQCMWCLDWWAPSAADPAKTIDGQVFHLKAEGDRAACFWKVWRSRRLRPTC